MKCAPRRGQRGGILTTLISLVFLTLFCLTLYLLRHPLMRAADSWWIIEDPLEHADALLVLSDDNFYADRVTRAAELFREGKAPIVVASGRRLRPYAGIAELMEHDLIERGVPKDKIIRLPQDADSTRDEAEALRVLSAQRRWHRVIVVTSNYHTRRARYIFGRIFPQGIEVRMASARDGDFDPERWWENRKSIKRITREWVGYLEAWWELRGRTHREGSNLASLFLVGGSPGKAQFIV
jgi:uncharacterized SAM-binding protein YcdF (DUF218 family)